MRIEQAIYGEVRGGHALRLASDRGHIPIDLVSRLDLPDTAPPGVVWSPFLSGFPHGDRYVLARTFADPTATRAGMVLSHAIILPLIEVVAERDLRPFLALLLNSPEVPNSLETLDISISGESIATAIDLIPAAEALILRGSGPVVRIGTQDFEDLAVALWFHCWPEIRARFAFRLSFGPHDIVEALPPSLVCTPTSLTARWAGYRIVGTAGPTPISRAAHILSGGAEAEPILHFAREIGAHLNDFASLPPLDRTYEISSSADPSFEECVTAVRLVERLSPDPMTGAVSKAKLINRLNERFSKANVQDVLLLRNLGTTGLQGAEILWASLSSWVAHNKFADQDDVALLSILDDALSTANAVEPWRNAIVRGIVAAAASISSTFPVAFWRWVQARPATLIALADHFLRVNNLEIRLSEAAPPKITVDAGNVIMEIARRWKWLRLHGAAASASLTPQDAIKRQLSVDPDPGNRDGVRFALRYAAPAQLVALALEIDDPHVLSMASEEASRIPHLLKDIDFSVLAAQEIWAGALSFNADAWRGPIDPKQSFLIVLQNLLDGKTVSMKLIAALSVTPVADLHSFSQRAQVWPLLAESARINLLKATASGWLEHSSAGDVPYAPDSQLETAILTSVHLDDALRTALNDVESIVRLISALPGFGESRFLRWLADWAFTRRSMTVTQAEMLGRVIRDRRWQRAVDQLIQLVRSDRDDLKPILRICRDMVGIFTQWSLGLSIVSREEKWSLFEELAADLYPGGPDENELWDRAGGKNADLRSSGSGRSRWRDAIAQMRRGKGPSLTELFREMKYDFPLNDKIHRLANDFDFKIGYR